MFSLDRVFQKKAADVEVRQAEGEVAAADLKEVRTAGNEAGKFAETGDETFGRRFDFGNVRRFQGPG